MMLSPAVIALLSASFVTTLLVLGTSAFGLQVARNWNIRSGSELQLRMERRTYLISALLALAFSTEIVTLALFVFNADRMAPQFVGAMCAVGSLNANAYGFPALLLKIAVFFLAAGWLTVNHLDNRGYDYPLVRIKYAMLLAVAPVMAAAAAVQALYFAGLEADVITSCCGSLFGDDAKSVVADLTSFAPAPAMAAFYAVLALTLAAGAGALRRPGLTSAYGVLAAGSFAVSMVAMVSFLSLYIYEHPHHHCPFCIIKPEYGHVGYAIYVPLFAAVALAIGSALVRAFENRESLAAIAPAMSRRLIVLSLVLFTLFTAVATIAVTQSNLKLFDNVSASPLPFAR